MNRVAGMTTRVEDPRPWKRYLNVYNQQEVFGELTIPGNSPGPWDDEPDWATWLDPATGYACMTKRAPTGGWCGYVNVPRDHPLHGVGYDGWLEDNLDVHGGITFAGVWFEEGDWWFGFDCGHAEDITPAMPMMPGPWPMAYRTLDYVVGEVTRLAAQLAAHTG